MWNFLSHSLVLFTCILWANADGIATTGNDPFSGLPESFESNGVFLNYSRAANDVGEASTVIAANATPGTIIPGRVIKEGNPLVWYKVGNAPFLLFCIHTETLGWRPFMKNWPLSRRACSGGNCKTLEALKNLQGIPDEDFDMLTNAEISKKVLNGLPKRSAPKLPLGDESGFACESIGDYMANASDNSFRPHVVYTSIPKMYADLNRHPGPSHWLKPRGTIRKAGLLNPSPEVIASYHDVLGFVREAKNLIASRFGYGWTFNFHSQGSVGNRCDVGVGWETSLKKLFKNPNLKRSDIENAKTLRGGEFLKLWDYEARGLTPYESIFGKYAIGEILSLRGIGAAPSRAHQYVPRKEDCFCLGSSFTNRIGMPNITIAQSRGQYFDNEEVINRPIQDWYVGNFNNAIVEGFKPIFTDTTMQDKFIKVWGETLLDIGTELYNLTFYRTSSRPFQNLTQTYDSMDGGEACAGKKSKVGSTMRSQSTRDILTLDECVEKCLTTSSCRYVEMNFTPKLKRKCDFYKTCPKTVTKRFVNVVDVQKYISPN